MAVRASRQLHCLAPREPDSKEPKLLEFKMGIRKTRMEGFIDFTQSLARIQISKITSSPARPWRGNRVKHAADRGRRGCFAASAR
jgi:hypothetical protein